MHIIEFVFVAWIVHSAFYRDNLNANQNNCEYRLHVRKDLLVVSTSVNFFVLHCCCFYETVSQCYDKILHIFFFYFLKTKRKQEMSKSIDVYQMTTSDICYWYIFVLLLCLLWLCNPKNIYIDTFFSFLRRTCNHIRSCT